MSKFRFGQMVHFDGYSPYSITSNENEFIGVTASDEQNGCVWVSILTCKTNPDLSFFDLYDSEFHAPFIESLRKHVATNPLFFPHYEEMNSFGMPCPFGTSSEIVFFCVSTTGLVSFDPSSAHAETFLRYYHHVDYHILQNLISFYNNLQQDSQLGIPASPSLFL